MVPLCCAVCARGRAGRLLVRALYFVSTRERRLPSESKPSIHPYTQLSRSTLASNARQRRELRVNYRDLCEFRPFASSDQGAGGRASSWLCQLDWMQPLGLKSPLRSNMSSRPRKPSESDQPPVEFEKLPSDAYFWQRYVDVQTLGRGAFGLVREVVHRQSRQQYAVKILFKGTSNEGNEGLATELHALLELRHRNLVSLHAAYETPSKLYLVMSLCRGGALCKGRGPAAVYSEAVTKSILLQIIRGLEHMHSKDFIHCDLKPENVLFVESGADRSTYINIIDFGLTQALGDRLSPGSGGRLIGGMVGGTHSYLAPEVIRYSRGLTLGYSKPVDLWAVGLLAFIMMFGYNPFERSTRSLTELAILECDWSFPAGNLVGKQAKRFVLQLLKQNPSERLTAAEAAASEWLADRRRLSLVRLPLTFASLTRDYAARIADRFRRWKRRNGKTLRRRSWGERKSDSWNAEQGRDVKAMVTYKI